MQQPADVGVNEIMGVNETINWANELINWVNEVINWANEVINRCPPVPGGSCAAAGGCWG